MNHRANWLVVAAMLTGWVCASTGEPVGEEPPPPKANADPKVFVETIDQARAIESPADGQALWEKYLANHPDGPMIEQAKRELALWKSRVDQNLARYGPNWIPRAELDKKNARVEELLGQAEAASAEPDKAARLFGDAAAAHPFRIDIPFRKFQMLFKAGREREAAVALGGALRLEPRNAAILNNLGVLAARQKQWPAAFDYLLKATQAGEDKDSVWDNFDQTTVMAEEANCPPASLSAADAQLRGVIARLHKAGKRVGETRWGNSWVSEADLASRAKENAEANRRVAAAKAVRAQLQGQYLALEQSRGQLEKQGKTQYVTDQIKQIDAKLKLVEAAAEKAKQDLEAARNSVQTPTHAGKLVLLNLDGSELENLEIKPPDEPKDKEPVKGVKPLG